MNTSSEVLDAINSLERAFPVGSWRAGDIDLWPTYRFRLYGNAINRVLHHRVASGPIERLRHLTSRAFGALLGVSLARGKDRRMNAAPDREAAAVFLSDGVCFVRLGERWFDYIVDPVIEGLGRRGRHSLKLTPLSARHVPRHAPSLFVQPALDRIKLTARRSRFPANVPRFAELRAEARKTLGDVAPSEQWLQVQAARLDALAVWFGGFLARSRAELAFANTYYSLEGLAFVLAARRLGVRSIDLQHGVQGRQHVAYARWCSVPPGGYSTLPDEFWVWGADEAGAIAEWSASCAAHAPRITGNYWLHRWFDDADPLVAGFVARARALRAPPPATLQVLACLTWGVGEEENDKLLEAAALCGPSVAWWWRLHPVMAARTDEFVKRLEQRGLDASRIGEVTSLPLHALLRCADLTVAHSSTVIKEAAEFGVESVVTSDYGAEVFKDLVERGVAVRAIEARAIAGAITARAHRLRAVPTVPAAGLQASIDTALAARYGVPT